MFKISLYTSGAYHPNNAKVILESEIINLPIIPRVGDHLIIEGYAWEVFLVGIFLDGSPTQVRIEFPGVIN